MTARRSLVEINGEVQDVPIVDEVLGAKTISLMVENPVTGDDIARVKLRRALRVLRIVALRIQGTGTFDWELRYSPNANDQGAGTLLHSGLAVANETTGVVIDPPFTSGNPAIIPIDNWVWLELTAVSTGIARPVAALVIIYGVEQ